MHIMKFESTINEFLHTKIYMSKICETKRLTKTDTTFLRIQSWWGILQQNLTDQVDKNKDREKIKMQFFTIRFPCLLIRSHINILSFPCVKKIIIIIIPPPYQLLSVFLIPLEWRCPHSLQEILSLSHDLIPVRFPLPSSTATALDHVPSGQTVLRSAGPSPSSLYLTSEHHLAPSLIIPPLRNAFFT